MIRREVQGNKTTLRGSNCEFEFTQPAKGTVLVRISGDDRGEFGESPFHEISAALDEKSGLELFVDTSAVTGASLAVSEQWRDWFQTHRKDLRSVHILAVTRFFQVTMAVVRELSSTASFLKIHSDINTFNEALERTVANRGKAVSLQTPAREKTAVIEETAIYSRKLEGEKVVFEDVACRLEMITIHPGVLHLSIRGHDKGTFSATLLNEMNDFIENYPQPVTVLVDASAVSAVNARASEVWTKWISNNQQDIRAIHVLTNSRLVQLTLSIAQLFSRTGQLMKVHSDAAEFRSIMKKLAPEAD